MYPVQKQKKQRGMGLVLAMLFSTITISILFSITMHCAALGHQLKACIEEEIYEETKESTFTTTAQWARQTANNIRHRPAAPPAPKAMAK